jgi:hypothetical protein
MENNTKKILIKSERRSKICVFFRLAVIFLGIFLKLIESSVCDLNGFGNTRIWLKFGMGINTGELVMPTFVFFGVGKTGLI